MPSNIESHTFNVNLESFADSFRALVVEATRNGQKFSIHLGFQRKNGDTAEWYRDAEDDAQVISGVLGTKFHVRLTREILTEGTLTLRVAEVRPQPVHC